MVIVFPPEYDGTRSTYADYSGTSASTSTILRIAFPLDRLRAELEALRRRMSYETIEAIDRLGRSRDEVQEFLKESRYFIEGENRILARDGGPFVERPMPRDDPSRSARRAFEWTVHRRRNPHRRGI